MYNQGLELRLAVDLLKETAVKWTLDMNASTVKNEITRMPFGAEDEIISGTKKLMEGRSIYDYWLREWYGVILKTDWACIMQKPSLMTTTICVPTFA
jgi:hypothetical protein